MALGKNKKLSKLNPFKALAWLIEMLVRFFAGYVIITNFDNVLATAVAVYMIVTAIVLLVVHFVKAYSK